MKKFTYLIILAASVITLNNTAQAENICTAETSFMAHRISGVCQFANDGCEKRDLIKQGFIETSAEACSDGRNSHLVTASFQSAHDACIQVVVPVVSMDDGSCRVALDGCQLQDYIEAGFRVDELGSCNSI